MSCNLYLKKTNTDKENFALWTVLKIVSSHFFFLKMFACCLFFIQFCMLPVFSFYCSQLFFLVPTFKKYPSHNCILVLFSVYGELLWGRFSSPWWETDTASLSSFSKILPEENSMNRFLVQLLFSAFSPFVFGWSMASENEIKRKLISWESVLMLCNTKLLSVIKWYRQPNN